MTDRQWAISGRIADVLSLVVPFVLGMIGVLSYVRHDYWRAILYLALAVYNVSCTVYLQRRLERRRAALKATLDALERTLP